MATRNVDTSIRYLIDVSEKGLKQAIALTKDLGAQSKTTQAGVDASMKAVQTQYNALAKVASSADAAVSKAAIDSATVVNKALDSQIAKLRDAGASYTAIVAKQREFGVSSAELAAAVKRSSAEQIAAMRAVRDEAAKLTLGQRLGAVGSRISGAAGAAAGALGGGAVAALGITGGLAYAGLEKSRSVTEGTLAIRGSTGLPTNQALALATIATSLGIAPRSIGQAFGTLGGVTTKALAGNATAGAAFSTLGISRQQVAGNVDNPLALFDLVTERARTLPATQQAAVQRQLLGRGSSIVGQLTAGGPLAASVEEVQKNLPGLDPKKLIQMQEAFVHLKEVSTAFELSFAQSFGPSIGAALNAITPLLPKVAAGFKDAFSFIKGVVDGPVGQALGKFGTMAFDAGKKLVEAFRPARPFFENVLLPLIKGIAIGIGVGLIGAINLVTAGVKILAPVFGALGDVLKPLKTVIQDVGVVLGIVFSGDALGAIFKGIGAVVGEIPLLGKALDFLIKPVEVVGSGIGQLYDILSGTFSKIFGFIPGVGSKLASLFGGLASSIVGAFAAVPDQMLTLGEQIVQAIVDGISKVPGAVVDAITNLLPAPLRSSASTILGAVGSVAGFAIAGPIGAGVGAATGAVAGLFAHGGRVFNAGGLVPAMVSPQEQVIYGNSSWTVPGPPTAADSVFAMLPPGAAVMTSSGQAMMGMGASLDEALAMQAPHFAAGGTVNALGWNVPAPRGSGGGRGGGGRATPRYLHNVLIGNFTTAGWHAYLRAHPSKPATGTDLGRFVATAYGPPWGGIEGTGVTATGVNLSAGKPDYIVAVDPSVIPLHSKLQINPNPFGSPNIVFKAEDTGGAIKGHRLDFYDWKGRADQNAWGRRSVDVRSAAGMSVTSTAGVAKTTTPTLSNAIASLTGQTAFAGGYQAGLSGQNLIDTLRSGVLSTLIGDVAISKSGLIGGLNIATNQQAAAIPGGSVGQMVAKANEIASHRYNYEWGGGHNSSFAPTHGSGHGSGPGIGFDCSGAVSSVLHAGGVLNQPLVAGQFMSWGQKGRGKQASIFSSPSHVFMELGGRYFGTSTMNPGGGANWIPRFPENMPATTHPPGLRRGGIIGFRAGGKLQQKYADVTAFLQRIWSAAAPFYHRAGQRMKTPTYTTGQDALFVGVDQTPGVKAGHRGLFLPNWIVDGDGSGKGLRAMDPEILQLMVHEWAHEYQDTAALARADKLVPASLRGHGWNGTAEGGAQAFAERFAPAIFSKAAIPFVNTIGKSYGPETRWVNRNLGPRWVANTQFGFRAGGKVSYPASYYRGRFGDAYRGFYLWGKYGRGVPSDSQDSNGHLYKDLSLAEFFPAWNAYFGFPQQASPKLPRGLGWDTFDRWENKWAVGDRFRAGGKVGLTRQPRVNPLAQPLRGVSALLSQSDATDVSALMGLLASELDDVHKLTFQNLEALASSLAKRSIKGLDPIQQRRLSTALNLVDAAIGNRIGLSVQAAQDAVDAITRGNAHKVALSTLAGVDPSSTQGLKLAVQLDQAVVQGLNAQVGTLTQALQTAKKYGDKATIKQVTDQLNTALGNLDQAAIQAMNDWRASVERAAQDAVDSASQAVSVAQAGEQILGLQQQLAGTDQTPGGGKQLADYINTQVIPAFRAQLASQQADQAAAASVGDTARVNADILAELQTQTSILSESKTAQDAIKQNTQPLKAFGGQLAFQFQGESFRDLAALGSGS